MFRLPPRPKSPRRGVTLVEMLVTVALLVLMMTVIVQIFTAATTAVSAARTYQDLDSGLRQLDATIRQDLGNVTANFSPPLSPDDNLGYFEYSENSFADPQGEDSDDTLRFTVNAPEGQLFTGRMYIPINTAALSAQQLNYYLSVMPITIQSQKAEVIYFLRNGNLYRRVLLIAPEHQSVLSNIPSTFSGFPSGVFFQNNLPMNVGWMGLNDLSVRPSPTNLNSASPPTAAGALPKLILNTLGDLTNREHRYASPRFTSDYVINDGGTTLAPDGLPDDQNADSVPDYWPTLNYDVVNKSLGNTTPTAGMINEPVGINRLKSGATYQTLAFPYVYPYAYSKPDPSNAFGWIHSPDPTNGGGTLAALLKLNHSPIDIGDSLPPPGGNQTWWGFPTWRETMSPSWNDPFKVVSQGQPFGLIPADPGTAFLAGNPHFLPPMTLDPVGAASGLAPPLGPTPYRTSAQLYNDGAGSDTFAAMATKPYDALWKQVWEDDLVMTGVRSFDVKAYDNSYPGYVDLGWGDDLRLYVPYVSGTYTPPPTPPMIAANLPGTAVTNSPAYSNTSTPSGFPIMFNWPPISPNHWRLIGDTLAHEGRMPPVYNDFRLDPQFVDAAMESQTPVRYKLNELNPQLPKAASSYFNVGDANPTSPGVIRLRRVWDSWSTEYTQAPGKAVNSSGILVGLGGGYPPMYQPVYPSYPPPYRAPLRGIQIQIRVADSRGERLKVLTIRQDFSDKLGQANQ